MTTHDASPYALTAEKLLASEGVAVGVQPNVVLVYDASLAPGGRFTFRDRRVGHPFRKLLQIEDNVDLVVAAGPGSPVAAITVGLLSALGVRRIIAVGTAGLLDAGDQSLRVITRCESDEGTSRHYGGQIDPSTQLSQQLAAALDAPSATTVTTDVPFRQTRAHVQKNRGRAEVIEMECAALFAAANDAGIEAGAVIAVSDVFEPTGWRRCDASVTQTLLQQALAGATQVLKTTS